MVQTSNFGPDPGFVFLNFPLSQYTEISPPRKNAPFCFLGCCGLQVPNSQFSLFFEIWKQWSWRRRSPREKEKTVSPTLKGRVFHFQISKVRNFFFFLISYSSVQNKFQKYVYNAKISYFSDLNSDMLFKNLSERESERKTKKKKKLARWIRIQWNRLWVT